MKTQTKFVNASLVSVVNGSIIVKSAAGIEHTFTNASIVSVNNGTIIIESEWEPEKGELIKYRWNGDTRYGIFKEIIKCTNEFWTYGCSMSSLSELPADPSYPKFRVCSNVLNIISPVTPEEQKEFDDFCKSQGKIWNKEKLQWEKHKWHPKLNDIYYYIDLETEDGIGKHICENDYTDQLNYECGNCFQNKKQAQKAAEKVKELLKSL